MDFMKLSPCLLVVGFLITLSSAANTCGTSTVNETELCPTKSTLNFVDLCKLTFKEYACLSVSDLTFLPDDFLVKLSGCYSNNTVLALDHGLTTLLFSKLESNKVKRILSIMEMQSSMMSSEWRMYLATGIQSLMLQDLNAKNSSSWIEPFYVYANATLIQCLESQNATCELFQKLVKGLGQNYNSMTVSKKQELYPAIKTFLLNQKNKTGSACERNVSASTWVMQNFGNFSEMAELNDFSALYSNFTALEVLPLLTLSQLANLSLDPSLVNKTDAFGLIMGMLKNKSDVSGFLMNFNAIIAAKNQTSLPPALSQALLNKTFQIIVANLTSFNNTEWTQLFQSHLSFVLPEVTADQLSLIPKNISCPFFQAVVKGLSQQFPKWNPGKHQQMYNSFIRPYLTQKGSACSSNVNSSTWISQNLGNFSKIPTYGELISLNSNFSALDALSFLTAQQVAGYAVNSSVVNTTASVNLILGTLHNKTDVYNFMMYLNDSLITGNHSSLSPALSQALFNKTFQVIGNNISTFNSSDWSQLLTNHLNLTLTQITADQLSLIPQNISCDSYHSVVQAFNPHFPKMTAKTQEQVYTSFIKTYLTQKGGKITCYNQTEANSSAWFVANMASFFTYTNETDLGLFANESMQQVFASHPACIQLVSQLNLSKDPAKYYTSLLTSNPSFNLNSLPNNFLCYLSPSAIKNLNSDAAVLDLNRKINKECRGPSSASPAPSSDEMQVTMLIVSKVEKFNSSTLNDLGASAVCLSQSQINSISDNDLLESVSSLSNVTGWNKGQSRSIVNKLLKAQFKMENLESLGSLVRGLPSYKLQELDSKQVSNSLKTPQFVNQLSDAPSALKTVFVSKAMEAYPNPINLVKNIPSSLASYIPKSLLDFKTEKPVAQDLNEKDWSPDQAAMFFDQVVAPETSFTQFSPSVLQGFTCSSSSKLSDTQAKSLAKTMLTQNTLLDEQQLNCLSRQVLKSGIPTDLDKYPKEILLFISPSNYTLGGCMDYFTIVGQSNISVLNKGSELRSGLLTQALACMNVTSTSLNDSNIKVLGHLACDLNATYIENAPSSLLTQLSQCNSFTVEQQNAIQTVIAKGNTVFGPPANWSKGTISSLGCMNGFLSKSVLKNIPNSALQSWMKEAIENGSLSRQQFASIVHEKITAARRRRAAGCEASMQITADKVKNPILPLLYTVDQLDACLNNSILVAYLPDLSVKAFTDEQLMVLKKKLDQVYPGGYPESVIPNLGAIAFLCNETDIAKWNISSVDTLEGLLASGPPNSTAKVYIGKFTDSAKSINGSALNVIGSKYICLLTSAQLSLITPTAISEAKSLSISNCNQTVKDALYLKANTSFQSMASQSLPYFNLMKPYLGGAPAADLKNLATKNVSMDIGTFINLNPEAVKSLTVDDVKGLLGNNTIDLKANQNNSVVSAWIKLQKQSDLDKLGIGLQGGIQVSSQTSTPTTLSSTPTTISSTLSSTTTTSRPNSAPPRSIVLGYSVLFCAVMAVLLS